MKVEDFCVSVGDGIIPSESPTCNDYGIHLGKINSFPYNNVKDYGYHLEVKNENGDTKVITDARSFCIKHDMWAIVDMQWTKRLASWIDNRTVLEVMAGNGWLAKALRNHGVDIKPTDGYCTHKISFRNLVAIENIMVCDAITKYCDCYDILLVSWPPYGDTEIGGSLRQWSVDKPIIYIGEDRDGCNADENFFKETRLIKDQPDIRMPVWSGMHDIVEIRKRDCDED